jgi:hypothetical protein
MGQQKPRKMTSLSRPQVVSEILAAFKRRFGRTPTRLEARALYTLMAHETRHGKSIIAHNWGNVSTRQDSGHDWWLPTWLDADYIAAQPEGPRLEQLYKLELAATQGKAPEAFRAYDSHEEGADAWLGLLATDRYTRIVQARGPEELWRAVWETGYCYEGDCNHDAVRQTYASIWEATGRPETVEGAAIAAATAGGYSGRSKPGGGGLVAMLSAGVVMLGGAVIWSRKR